MDDPRGVDEPSETVELAATTSRRRTGRMYHRRFAVSGGTFVPGRAVARFPRDRGSERGPKHEKRGPWVGPRFSPDVMVEPVGFEPTTFRLQSGCSPS